MSAFDQRAQLVGSQVNAGEEARPRPVPSVGRVVHYWRGAIGPLAALVVDVATPGDPESRLNLVAWGKGGAEHALLDVPPRRPPGDGEGWCWPPYVPPAPGGHADGR